MTLRRRHLSDQFKDGLGCVSAKDAAVMDLRDSNSSNYLIRSSRCVLDREERYFHISMACCMYLTSSLAGYSLAVRSYGQIYVFDIRNQITSVAEPTKSPFVVSELMSISSDDYASHVDGKIVDMSFSSLDAPTLYLVTEQGAGYQCSRKNQKKIM